MAIVRSVPSEKTWKSLFQTLAKAFRLQEAEETALVFDNYSNNQEFSLKQQKRINRVTNSTVRMYMEVSPQEMPQGKAYQLYLENTEYKVEFTDRFTQYIQQDHLRSKLKGNIFYSRRSNIQNI